MKTVLAKALVIVTQDGHDFASAKAKPNYHRLAGASPGGIALTGPR